MFIVLEGIDGAGKTTIKQLVFQYLKYKTGKIPLSLLPQAWISPNLSFKIVTAKYKWLSWEKSEITSAYVKDKELLSKKLIEPYSRERVVICDRYYLSDVVYHKHLYNIDTNETYKAYKNSNITFPDLQIYIRANPKTAYNRIIKRDSNLLNEWEKEKNLNNIYEIYENVINDIDENIFVFDNETVTLEKLKNKVQNELFPVIDKELSNGKNMD